MEPATDDRRFNPWLFFTGLALPGILSLVVLSIDDSNYGEKGLLTLLLGSAVAGIVCGIHFARSRRTWETGSRVGIGIASVIGCAIAAFALGSGGCFLIAIVTEGF